MDMDCNPLTGAIRFCCLILPCLRGLWDFAAGLCHFSLLLGVGGGDIKLTAAMGFAGLYSLAVILFIAASACIYRR